MFYEFRVTSPANTAKSAATRLDAELMPGVVRGVEVQFPRGCVGLVHAAIHDALHQVWPTNPEGDLAGDDARISWSDSYPVPKGESVLLLYVWNDDDSYAHTVTFRFDVVEAGAWERQQRALAALTYLADWYDTQPAVAAEGTG
jgi:hypothetical protein